MDMVGVPLGVSALRLTVGTKDFRLALQYVVFVSNVRGYLRTVRRYISIVSLESWYHIYSTKYTLVTFFLVTHVSAYAKY